MDPLAKRTSIVLVLLLLGLVGYLRYGAERCPCKDRISYADVGLNQGLLNLDRLFRPPDSATLAAIWHDWDRDSLTSDSVRMPLAFSYQADRKARLLAHYHAGEKHYGAVILPKDYDSTGHYPLLVWANGLNQRDPTVHLHSAPIQQLVRQLEEYFIVVPSYRGQALELNRRRYCSDGFFGDAFDGATDDALRLLEVTKGQFSSIDTQRIAVCGLSRGGTVALLMGARDTSLRGVVAIAGPTNFLSEDMFRRHNLQYRYQFLSRSTDLTDIRDKIIKSSPVYFIERYPQALLLIQGRNDKIVPVDQATAIMEQLEGRDPFTALINDNGHAFSNWPLVAEWIRQHTR
ncbi:MAG: prolyl oligopeptidase family serine peptidase [Lewinella sp.]|nr:prolyl oligopeptidase family serine peptidase [Lewinella sp.]